MTRCGNAIAIAVTTAVLAAAQRPGPAHVALKAAIDKELVDGDLKGAIALYAKAVSEAKADRAIAAKALIRMAECHEKLGSAESRRIYERVLREYAEQKEAVATARAKLGSGDATTSGVVARQVWTGRNAETAGTISADGRLLSFVDWDTGDLAVRDLATGTDRRLTTNASWRDAEDFAEESAISRDGKQVAYIWYKSKEDRPELRVGNLTGEFKPRTVYDNPDLTWISVHDWSPDGNTVAVLVNRNDRTSQIGLISIRDGSLRVLRSVGWRTSSRIAFSPDGRYLGFDLRENEIGPQRDVFLLAVDGSVQIHAVAHRGNDILLGWSPDGQWLLFGSDRMGSMSLWGLPLAGGIPRGTPELLKEGIADQAQPIGVTHDGALFYGAFDNAAHQRVQIAPFDFRTGKFSSEAADVTQDYRESSALPDWSPDGGQIAYLSWRGSSRISNTALVIRSLETGQLRELHPKLSYFSRPRWAPDGQSFLTLGTDLLGRTGIYRIDKETAAATMLVQNQPEYRLGYPVWSPDGKSILFPRNHKEAKDTSLIRRDLSTGEERELIRRTFLGGVNISPDGQSIVTPGVDKATNARILLLIPFAGGEARELTRVPSEVAAEALSDGNQGVWLRVACWAPDSGSFLAWKTRGRMVDQNTEEMWRIPINGSAPQMIEKRNLSLGGLAVHPDGRRIAFTVTETNSRRNSEIWSIQNFLPKLRAAR